MSYRLGVCCHWCGKDLGYRNDPKKGNHLFCRGGRCKMAHHRAYHKWLAKCVTPESDVVDQASQLAGGKGNADKSGRRNQASGRSTRRRSSKRNARKGAK